MAQGSDFLLETEACREDPHSKDCICATVRKFGLFPKEFDSDGNAKDVSGDNLPPTLGSDGIWVDNKDAAAGEDSDLQFMADDRYNQRCALSYFREDQRRLWYFAVALGASFTVISLIWVGVVHMQNTASGVDISKTRAMLVRVIIGLIILASAFLIWEGLNDIVVQRAGLLDAGAGRLP